MSGISEEDDEQLTVLFEDVLKIQEQFKATENDRAKIIALYKEYYEKYKEFQPKSKDIAIRALTKIRNNELLQSPLTNEEITELHRHLGISFTKDGNIFKIDQKAPILKYVKNILIESLQEISENFSTDSKSALKKIQQNESLTTEEINLLYQELGIRFEIDGTILQINNNGIKLVSKHPLLKLLLDTQPGNKSILVDTLSRMQNNELQQKPLTTIEITLLHRNLGILLNESGTILTVSPNVISYMQDLLTQLTQNYGLYTAFKAMSNQKFPSQEELQKMLSASLEPDTHLSNIVQLLKPMITILLHNKILMPDTIVEKLAIPDPVFNLLKKTDLSPATIFDKCKYPDPSIPELLESLEQQLTSTPTNEEVLNETFLNLYNHLGIKCHYTENSKTIKLQKVKFNSPILPTNPEYKKYNLHFDNRDTLYATRTNNIPIYNNYKKTVGKGASADVIRAIRYNPSKKEGAKNKEEIAVKKMILESRDTSLAAVREVMTLQRLGQGGTAKRSVDKFRRKKIHIVQEFAKGSPLNQANSSKLNFKQKIALMRLIASQLRQIHNEDQRHNDLKGDNIIVDYEKLSTITDPKDISTENAAKSEFARIVDYGSIETIDPNKLPKYNESPLGTALYISTEICVGYEGQGQKPPENYKDFLKSDIYSLGKVLICDANLHNLEIAYKMADSLYTNRPTIDEFLKALDEYQSHADQIVQQEAMIASTKDLSKKVQAIKKLCEEKHICSQEYYNTLVQVLERGTKEDLQTMQTLPIFKHLFKVDPLALHTKIYKQRPEIQFENKMLELLQHAKKNYNHELALILIQHLYEQSIDTAEAWCNIQLITDVLQKDRYTYEFVCNVIKEYQTQHPELTNWLTPNTTLSSPTTKEHLSDPDTDTASSLGYSSDSSNSPTSTNRPQSRRSPRSR